MFARELFSKGLSKNVIIKLKRLQMLNQRVVALIAKKADATYFAELLIFIREQRLFTEEVCRAFEVCQGYDELLPQMNQELHRLKASKTLNANTIIKCIKRCQGIEQDLNNLLSDEIDLSALRAHGFTSKMTPKSSKEDTLCSKNKSTTLNHYRPIASS